MAASSKNGFIFTKTETSTTHAAYMQEACKTAMQPTQLWTQLRPELFDAHGSLRMQLRPEPLRTELCFKVKVGRLFGQQKLDFTILVGVIHIKEPLLHDMSKHPSLQDRLML